MCHSTVEWGTAMLLFWQYADVTGKAPRIQHLPFEVMPPLLIVTKFCAGNQRWKGLTWGMLPLLGGAMAACTYHFFYNPPELDFLVAIQVGSP